MSKEAEALNDRLMEVWRSQGPDMLIKAAIYEFEKMVAALKAERKLMDDAIMVLEAHHVGHAVHGSGPKALICQLCSDYVTIVCRWKAARVVK